MGSFSENCINHSTLWIGSHVSDDWPIRVRIHPLLLHRLWNASVLAGGYIHVELE